MARVTDPAIPVVRTVNGTGLLDWPETVTTMSPLEAPIGTGATIVVVLQLVGVATLPLNVTKLDPWIDPKLVPLIVTEVPTGAAFGDKAVTLGGIVNITPLLATPDTVTTTGPEVAPLGTAAAMLVALQLVGVAGTPLNSTVLAPCVAPNVAPLMVTDVPGSPDVGDRLEMLGATEYETPLLARPATVTTTGPVVAPLGTAAVILVPLQLVGVARTPVNVTVLLP